MVLGQFGMKTIFTTLLAALISVGIGCFAPVSAATVTIANSSFEGGTTGRPTGFTWGLRFSQLNSTFPGWDTFNGLQGWTVSGGGGNRVEVHSDASSRIDAKAGDFSVSLDAGTGKNSTITQSVSIAAGTYILSFWYSPESVLSLTNGIDYKLGSVVSGMVNVGTNGARVGIWTQVQKRFSVKTTTQMNLSFAATGLADGVGGLIDDVTIISTVPVPAAGLVLLGWLVMLGGLRRARRGSIRRV